MINLVLSALIPVAFVVLLGCLAGRSKLIGAEGAKSLSTLVVNFALPCILFVSAFGFSPTQFENIDYVLTLLIGLTIPFFAALFLARFIWKKESGEAALFASNSGFPDMAYFGVPVVLTVLGQQGMLPVIVGNIISSIVIVPVVMAMLRNSRNDAQSPGVFSIILNTIRQPIVWAPLIGLFLVLFGVKLPALAEESLKLLGNASGGVALFTLGILLSALAPRIDLEVIVVVIVKNFTMPALVLMLVLLFKLDPVLAKGAIIIAACPAATMGALFCAQFGVAQDKIPGQILASNIVAIFSMAMWIVIAEKLF